MANTDLAIQIATTLDATGINKADKSVKSLDKTIKGLGRTLGLTLGATAMVAYGKQAVKAFAADEAAARRLATAVDNLGLSFSQSRVTEFIKNLETSSAIADDILRPAFQALLTTTGSLTKSQELLNNAIQISRASGVDLATVSQDLANGYVGITRGLKKYNTGLTQAELKSKSFADILGIMLVKSAGSANAYLETTQYKLDALTLAGNNAKETIGAGLVDAFARIAGGSKTSDAVKAIDNIAKAINGVTAATGFLVGGLVKLYKGLDFLTTFGGLTGADGSLVGILEGKPSTNRSKSPAGTAARTKQQRDAEAAAAKRAKELAALTKKQVASTKSLTAEQKKQTALKKAGTVFDLEQIQIIAALKGKLSEEDKIRLQAQLAILNENEALASSLTKQILMAQDSTGGLYKFFLAIGDMKIANPFAFLDQWIIEFQKKLNALQFPKFDPNAPSGGNGKKSPVVDPATNPFGFPIGDKGGIGITSIQPTVSANLAIQDTFNAVMLDALEAGNNYTQSAILAISSARYEAAAQAYGMGGNTNGTMQLELKVTGDGDLTNAIASSLQQQSLSTGNSTYINRRTGGFE
jgi:hypothetical protein